MSQPELPLTPWMLDSSTFIHATIVDRVPLIVLLRSPLFFPEFAFRFELGANAKETTRDQAAAQVKRKRIGVQTLTLADLDRIVSFGAPRKIGLGELACAVIADRMTGGVLCDDWHAKAWLDQRISTSLWDSIETILLDAAAKNYIGELDLADAQRMLERNRYTCRYDLQIEHVKRQMNFHRQGSDAADGQ